MLNKYYTVLGIGLILTALVVFGLSKWADTTVTNNLEKVRNLHHLANVEVIDSLREVRANDDAAQLLNFLNSNSYSECATRRPLPQLPARTFCRSGQNLLVKTNTPFANYIFRLNKNKTAVQSVLDENNRPLELAELPGKSFASLRVNEKGEIESIIRQEMFRGQTLRQNMKSDVIRFALFNEDRRYIFHAGTDWYGLTRAGKETVLNRLTGSEGNDQGGSTITEQTAKLLYTDEERSLTRRLWAMFLADAMEQQFTKEEILDFWLNATVMGKENPKLNPQQSKSAMLREQIIGFQTAAQSLFGKNLTELSPNEQAILVILPKAPNIAPDFVQGNKLNLNNPNHFDLEKRRQKALVDFAQYLESNGEKSKAALYRKAVNEPVVFKFKEDDLTAEESLNFYIRKDLKNLRTKYAPQNKDEYLTIVTTVDREFQKRLSVLSRDEMLRNKQQIARFAKLKGNFEIQTDLVVIQAQTGQLKAFSSLKTAGNQVLPNRTNINNPSHIASPAKPFHLATAIDEGKITIDTPILPSQCLAPDGFHFVSERKSDQLPLSISEHLINSNNNAFICVGNLAGIDRIEAKWRELFDLPVPTKEQYAKMGGHPYQLMRGLNRTEAELSQMQVAEAYTTLANSGLKTNINVLQKAFFSTKPIELPKPEQKQIFSPNAARLVTSVLQTKARREMKNLKPDSILAIKTGSSPISYWFVMYSPKTVIVGRFFIIKAEKNADLEEVYARDTIQPFMDNHILKLIQEIRPNWLK